MQFINALTDQEYSPKNTQILADAYDGELDDDTIHVAGFNQWKKIGRVVKKGEHGTKILMVCTKKTGEKDDDGNDERRRVCKTLTVFFDYQTTDLN